MLTSLGKSKLEMKGQKIPVIGSKVKVSIIPSAALIQCWCSNPAESKLVVWSMVRWPCLWLGDQKGDPPLLAHRICTT